MSNTTDIFNSINYYNDEPRVSYNMYSAFKMTSKTRQRCFVVASDVKRKADTVSTTVIGLDGIQTQKVASRIFLSFHDLEHFLAWKSKLPYVHEIIYCPSRKSYKKMTVGEDSEITNSETSLSEPHNSSSSYIANVSETEYDDELSAGRLAFDFDVTKPLPSIIESYKFQGYTEEEILSKLPTENYVNYQDFRSRIEHLIKKTFEMYYNKIDISKFVYIWQTSTNPEKFSCHLIVKNAYFSEHWVKQSKLFYAFMARISQTENTPGKTDMSELIDTIDFQVPKRNGTFRMIGSRKPDGSPLILNPVINVSIYDCLIGIYDYDRIINEQSISLDLLDYDQIDNSMEDSLDCCNSKIEELFRSTIKGNIYSYTIAAINDQINKGYGGVADITGEDLQKAFDVFEAWNDEYNNNGFTIRDVTGTIINLNRRRACPCAISGRVHHNENAYLIMRIDGSLIFKCRRDCTTDKGYSYVIVGKYKDRVVNYNKDDQQEDNRISCRTNNVEMDDLLALKFPRLIIPDSDVLANIKVSVVDYNSNNLQTKSKQRSHKHPRTTLVNSCDQVKSFCTYDISKLIIPEGLRTNN